MWRKGWKWTIFTLVLALAMVWTPRLHLRLLSQHLALALRFLWARPKSGLCWRLG